MSIKHQVPRVTWRLPLLCAVLAMVLSLFILAVQGSQHLGVPPLEGREILTDATAQLLGADLCLAGTGTWYSQVCFVPDIDSVPRAQAYGLWLEFSRWGLSWDRHARPMGIMAVLVFLLAAGLTLFPQSALGLLLSLALLHTSGVHMAVERGNFDLYMAALLVFSGWLLARSGTLRGALGIASLSLATALKLYCGAACLLGFWVGRRAHLVWILVSMLAVIAAVASIGFGEFLLLGQGAPEGETRFSTGSRWLWRQGYEGVAVLALMLAAAIFVLGSRSLVSSLALPREAPARQAIFELCTLTWLPLFLLKDSYDYRFSLLVPAAGYLLVLAASREAPRAGRVLARIALLGFLCASGMELPLSWLDRFNLPGVQVSLVVLKQLAAWALMASLATILLSLWRQRLAELDLLLPLLPLARSRTRRGGETTLGQSARPA